MLQVHVTWRCHQLSVEPLLHHGGLQSFLLGEEWVFFLGGRRQVAMHSSMGKGPQVVEEELQLVHLGGGEDALEGDCLGAAALRSVRR